MEQLDLINFVDAEAHQQGFAIVRAGKDEIGLTLSLEDDGDIEVFLHATDCERLLNALQQALSIAKQNTMPTQVAEAISGGTLVTRKPVTPSKDGVDVVLWKQEEVILDNSREVKHG